MRTIFCTALLAATTQAQTQMFTNTYTPINGAIDTADDVLDFITGMIEGVASQEQLSGLSKCISDSSVLKGEVITMVQDYEQKDFAGIISGTEEVGVIVSEISRMVADCADITTEDKATLQKMADAFKEPGHLAYEAGKHLMLDGKDIYNEIKSGVTEYQQGDYLASGTEFGKAGAIVLYGELSTPFNSSVANFATSDFLKIVEGLFMGAFLQSFHAVEECFTRPEEAIEEFQKSINDFKKGGAYDTAKGVKHLAYGVRDVAKAIKGCTGVAKDAENLIEFAASLETPFTFVAHVGKDLIVNGVKIFKQVYKAVDNFEDQEWFDFGENVGRILEMVFIGNGIIANGERVKNELNSSATFLQ